MAETSYTAGSGKSASTTFETKGKQLSDASLSAVSAGSRPVSGGRTIWDITSDEITATVLAELRF